MNTLPIFIIYYVWNVYLYSTPFLNGAFCFHLHACFHFLSSQCSHFYLAIFPPASLWFAIFSACVLIMTCFYASVTVYFARFCKWCISDEWDHIIYFLCGFLVGVLDLILTIVTVTYLTSVFIMKMVVYDICSICYIYSMLIVIHRILRW